MFHLIIFAPTKKTWPEMQFLGSKPLPNIIRSCDQAEVRDQVRFAPASIQEPTWTNSLINEGKTERARSPFLVRRNEAMRESDILALGGQSKILGRCWALSEFHISSRSFSS